METTKKILEQSEASELDIRQKKKVIETAKINREYIKTIQGEIAAQEYKPFAFADKKPTLSLDQAYAEYEEMFNRKLPFITPQLSEYIPLLPQVYIIGAISGQGKTTMGAAMTFEVLTHSPTNKVLYLSNEETYQDFMFRLGCLSLGHDLNDFRNKKLSTYDTKKVIEEAKRYQHQVVFERSSKTTSVSGIMEILEAPGIEDFSMVVLDYYQGVSRLNEVDFAADTDNHRASILDTFKQKITMYQNKCPLVILAQLKPIAHNDTARNIESRIKWGTSIYEAATFVMEAINVPKLNAMELYIGKGRYGGAHTNHKTRFSKGRYYSLSEDEYLSYIRNQALANASKGFKKDEDEE